MTLQRKEKYSSYIMVQWTSQQRCKCSVTDGTALCLHAVQQCGHKIIQGNGSDVSDDSSILSDKKSN